MIYEKRLAAFWDFCNLVECPEGCMDTGVYFAGFLVSAAAAVLVIFWLNPRLTVWRVVALLGIGFLR